MFKVYKEPIFDGILNNIISFKMFDLVMISILEFLFIKLLIDASNIFQLILIIIVFFAIPFFCEDFCELEDILIYDKVLNIININNYYKEKFIEDDKKQLNDNKSLIISYILKKIKPIIYIFFIVQILIVIYIINMSFSNKVVLFSILYTPIILFIIIKCIKIVLKPIEFKDNIILNKILKNKGKDILLDEYSNDYINLSDIDKYRIKIIRILKSIAKSIAYLQDNKYKKEVKIIQKITNNLVKTIERFRQQDKDGNEYYNIDYSILNDIIQMMETFNSSITELISNPTDNMESNLQKIKEEVEGFLDNTNRIIDNYYENDISRLKDRLKIELDVYGR